MNVKFSLAVGFVLAGVSVAGWAQSGTYKVKHTPAEKPPKKTAPLPMAKTGSSTTASANNSKDLSSIEHQTIKASASSRTTARKSPGTGAGLKPVKDKSNPPINFGANPGGKNPGTVNQSSNPYKGRLRQKHAGGH